MDGWMDKQAAPFNKKFQISIQLWNMDISLSLTLYCV